MKKAVTEQEFVDTIASDEYNSMTRQGAAALFEFIERMDDETGEETELDVVAIRCEFTEYASVEEAIREYGHQDIETLEELENHTLVIHVPESSHIIIADF